MPEHGTYTGSTQGKNIALVSGYSIEIFVSDALDGTYEYLASVKASGGEQSYVHELSTNDLTRYYKLRYRASEGHFTNFNAGKMGKTKASYDEAVDGGSQYGDGASFIGVIAVKKIMVLR